MPEIITRIQLPKNMTPQTITTCCGPVWLAIVRTSPLQCTGRLNTRMWMSSGHSCNWDSSLKTYCPQSAQFHFNWTRRCTGVRDKRNNDGRELKLRSLRRVSRVMFDTYSQAKQWIIYNQESGGVTAALTITLPSRTILALGRLRPL